MDIYLNCYVEFENGVGRERGAINLDLLLYRYYYVIML
jgi:hypothetical protein